VESVQRIGSCGDNEVVARDLDEAVRISNFSNINGHELPMLGLFDVGDLLTEAKLDVHLSTLLVQEVDKFVDRTISWSAGLVSYGPVRRIFSMRRVRRIAERRRMNGMNSHFAYIRVISTEHILWSSFKPVRSLSRGSFLMVSTCTLDMYDSTRLVLELLAICFHVK